MLKKFIKISTRLQYWEYCAGKTWNPIISSFCEDRGITAEYKSDSPFDLVIYAERNGNKEKYMFELKFEDLYSSLFSKDTTTSLEGELRKYIGDNPEFLYLIYIVENGMASYTQYRLDSLLADYPTCRRKSYKSQENAIEGIHRIVTKGAKPLDFGIPVYENWHSIPSTLGKQFREIDGIGPNKAKELAIYFEHNPFNLDEDGFKGRSFIDNLREIYPDTQDGYHPMINVIFDYYRSGIEPRENKMGKTKKKEKEPIKWEIL